jgi:multidrug resistance protein
MIDHRNSRRLALALISFATFTDIVAYSMAVPVLPDLGRKLNASPTTIGLLFASFGVTLLGVSIPMGAFSDRVGRRGPLVGGLFGLAAASVGLAFANDLTSLFLARLAQGAADAVTWVVGFALLADVYSSSERGKATGIVMSVSSVAFIVGPSIGGWLYEVGGTQLPFLLVSVMAAAGGVAMILLRLPIHRQKQDPVPVRAVVRTPAVAACAAAVVTVAATVSMLEPVMALHLEMLGMNPGRIGVVFGIAAVATTVLHPVYGRLADRWGARRLTLWGLCCSGCLLPSLGAARSFESAIVLFVVLAATMALVITPSLAYMAEATSAAGVGSFGIAYGLYNVAWAVGLLGGPAIGGFVFEQTGLAHLTLGWGPAVVVMAVLLARVRPDIASGLPEVRLKPG